MYLSTDADNLTAQDIAARSHIHIQTLLQIYKYFWSFIIHKIFIKKLHEYVELSRIESSRDVGSSCNPMTEVKNTHTHTIIQVREIRLQMIRLFVKYPHREVNQANKREENQLKQMKCRYVVGMYVSEIVFS